jgi:hypothetical protein
VFFVFVVPIILFFTMSKANTGTTTMNAAGLAKFYSIMADQTLSETDKYAGTGFDGLSDNVNYDQAIRYYVWIPMACIWLSAWLFAIANFWPHERVNKAHVWLRGVEFLFQGAFGTCGAIGIFAWNPTSEFTSQRTGNLQSLATMTIYLLFITNAIVMLVYSCRATRAAMTRETVHMNYIFIGLLLIVTLPVHMQQESSRNANLQQFAGLAMIVGSSAGRTSANGLLPGSSTAKETPTGRLWWTDVFREWLMYTLFSIAAVLMLSIKQVAPLLWLPQNANVHQPLFCLLIFFWLFIVCKVIGHLVYGGASCVEGCMQPSTSKRSRSSSKCCSWCRS